MCPHTVLAKLLQTLRQNDDDDDDQRPHPLCPLPLSALRPCSRCMAARYCGTNCQTAHWKAGHKLECAQLAAAAAAAGGST
jgi:hypothetical protein